MNRSVSIIITAIALASRSFQDTPWLILELWKVFLLEMVSITEQSRSGTLNLYHSQLFLFLCVFSKIRLLILLYDITKFQETQLGNINIIFNFSHSCVPRSFSPSHNLPVKLSCIFQIFYYSCFSLPMLPHSTELTLLLTWMTVITS